MDTSDSDSAILHWRLLPGRQLRNFYAQVVFELLGKQAEEGVVIGAQAVAGTQARLQGFDVHSLIGVDQAAGPFGAQLVELVADVFVDQADQIFQQGMPRRDRFFGRRRCWIFWEHGLA